MARSGQPRRDRRHARWPAPRSARHPRRPPGPTAPWSGRCARSHALCTPCWPDGRRCRCAMCTRACSPRPPAGRRRPADYRLAVEYARGAPSLSSTIRTGTCPTLGEMDLHLIGEGRHEELWRVLGAHVALRHPERSAVTARPSRSGRRTPAASGSSATSTTGTAARTRCARWAAPGSGSCSCPASAPAPGTSSRSAAPTAPWRQQGRPDGRRYAEVPPATALGRVRVRATNGTTRTGWPRAAQREPLAPAR